MSLQVEWHPNGILMRIEGALNAEAAQRLRLGFAGIAGEGARIALDLSGIDREDATGQGILILALKEALERRMDLRVVTSPRLRRLWEVTGIGRLIPGCDCSDAALGPA
jgi:anti-anti-sigma factor